MTFALFRRRRPAPPRPGTGQHAAAGPPPSVPELLPPPVPRAPEPLGWVVVATAPGGRPVLTHTSLMTRSEAVGEARQWRRLASREDWRYDVKPVGARP